MFLPLKTFIIAYFRFNVILASRSYPQLRATFQEYAKIANKDIDDTIQSEMSGDLKKSMLAIGESNHLGKLFILAIRASQTEPMFYFWY